MIGKVVEGRYTGGSVHRVPDKNAFYIQTEDEDIIALSKKNAISVTDVTDQYPSYGTKVMKVTWNDSAISIFLLGPSQATSQSAQQQPGRHVAACSVESNTDDSYQNKNNTAMKRLTCEMCGSNDLVKQEGVFVCQHCGCKYSVEEARKMMVEGTVDVSGSTVKIDNSANVQNYLANARRAKEKTDWEEAEKYYNMVEQNNAQNIEAIFYSSYAKAMLSLNDTDRRKRKQKFDIFSKSISVIDDYYDVKKSGELRPIIQKMSEDLIRMSQIDFVYAPSYDNADPVVEPFSTRTRFLQVELSFIESVEHIVKLDEQVYLYHILVKHYERCLNSMHLAPYGKQYIERMRERMENANNRLSQLDSSYNPKPVPKQGCYVATAVYGSYDCPQVWTLRRFRDYTLAKTWYGRAFIHTYYAISPSLVKWFGHTDWFKSMWKGKLDCMVANLNASGIEDTPYEDKVW